MAASKDTVEVEQLKVEEFSQARKEIEKTVQRLDKEVSDFLLYS